jgi:hypothetical protein
MGMVKISFKNLCIVLSLVCLGAFTCSAKYGGGAGTAQDPYLIYTAEDLNEIGLDDNSDDWDKHFALMADIDLSGFELDEFNLIGLSTSEPFSGVFDGRGHVISNFTYDSFDFVVGLFRVVGGGGVVKNVGLVDPNVVANIVVGTLVGSVSNGSIENCWVIGGSVYATAWQAGGLAGDVTGGTVLNCYCLGTSVVGEFSGAGGLAAKNDGGEIINSYAANPVFVTPSSFYVGAFVGEGAEGTYTGCFYDEQINPLLTGIGDDDDPCGLMGESTANLQQGSTFADAGWDIMTVDNQPMRNIWRMCEDGVYYPHLAVEYLAGDFACPDGVDIFDLAVFADEWVLEQLGADVDFNSDLRVDFGDWATFAAAWRSTEGSDSYSAIVDVSPAGGDGVIDEMDVILFVESWLGYGLAYLNADIEPYGGDGVVDFADFAVFANQWFNGQ